ncbi:hypothetical protein PENANT_c010G05086 [Penicillium antarcticum]|uniref:Uncharacterized protein n=1 Tax=Penicillium antarcticum TaxID=416450 RepID=A0A1V6Q8D9_9EURO|nr:hypothetical protein PENANT_c010G05086 [Penicillium antarcticum]
MATLFASISTDINRTSLIIIGVVASILTLALLYLMITRQSPARNDFEHLTPIGKWERSFGLDIQQPRRRRTHGFDGTEHSLAVYIFTDRILYRCMME